MARGDIYECAACHHQSEADWTSNEPACDACGSERVALFMRAPTTTQRDTLRAINARDIDMIDPDWTQRFHGDADLAIDFYRGGL